MSGAAPEPIAASLSDWDALPAAEIERLAKSDAETGVVPVLVLFDSSRECRVVSPFSLDATAEVLALVSDALRAKRLQ